MHAVTSRPVLLSAVVLALLAASRPAAAGVNVVELTAAQIKTDLLNHSYSATELVQSYIARIDQYNPVYNAFTLIDRSGALSQAAALDALLASPGNFAALSAMPMLGAVTAIKDSMNVAGMRTTSGYSGFVSSYTNPANPAQHGVDMVALEDAPIVTRLRDAGAIIIGKTNLPAFARSGANANSSVFGPTFNAYNVNRAPGGSSTGSAMSVSGSLVTIATAEETGGSIQNPAGAQGLVGVKTTFGLVPTTGGVPLAGSTRDVFGPNAKSVVDAANMLTAIAGYHASDANTALSTVASGHIPAGGYAAGLSTTALQGKRFGIYQPGATNAFKNTALSADVQAFYSAAQGVLSAQGATLVSDVFAGSSFQTLGGYSVWGGTNLPFELSEWMKTLDPSKSPTTVAAYKAATGIDLMAPSQPLLGSFTPTANNPTAPTVLATNAANPTVNDTASVQRFMDGRELQLAELRRLMDLYDLDGFFFPQQSSEPGLMPAAGGTGGYGSVTVSEINLVGVPQVNLPFGRYADGVPFSVAFFGDLYSEAELLGYAYDFESAIAGTAWGRVAPSLVPEPGSWLMLMAGGLGLCVWARRRKAPARA